MGIDIYAPIIPYEGLGGIKLYSTREELKDILEMDGVTKDKEPWGGAIQYYIEDKISLIFCVANDKLYKMSALQGYKGKAFGKVGIGMTEAELVEAEPSFVYDDFEEAWYTEKGLGAETDVYTQRVAWLTICIPEIKQDSIEFDKGNW